MYSPMYVPKRLPLNISHVTLLIHAYLGLNIMQVLQWFFWNDL